MTQLYVESSAIICWLFGEPESEKVVDLINRTDVCLSSVLSILETERVLIRAVLQNVITEGDRQRIRGLFHSICNGWSFLEITKSVMNRANSSFPVEPVRSLDAIHLASALEFLQVYPDLGLLSLDKRIIDNIDPLGLKSAL